MPEHVQCQECNSPLIGRTDKKFCSDQCRNTFNNKRRKLHEIQIMEINRILRKNRQVLHFFNPMGLTTIRKALLIKHGFNFSFHTHQFRTKAGVVYYFCYEYGYLLLPDDKVSLVTWQAYMNDSIQGFTFDPNAKR